MFKASLETIIRIKQFRSGLIPNKPESQSVNLPQSDMNSALTALTDWWEDMGVPADANEMALLKKAGATPKSPPIAQSEPTTLVRKKAKGGPSSVEEWVALARQVANGCNDLETLKAAVEAFEGCPLKAGANKTVVFDGVHAGPVMVIGEGAGGQEDRVGLPFVGKAGQLLDKMLDAIELSRQTNTFITNVTFWRPPGNRNPEPDELAVCRPFVDRMIELVQPKLIISAGGVSAKSLLDTKTGIMKLRGKPVDYTTPGGVTAPLVPVFHPAYLLRRPQDKSRAWRDLLLIQSLMAS